MAAPWAGRSPTCLACLRKMAAQPFCNSNGSASAAPVVQQVRLRSHRLRPRDLGVVVRLLEDIPHYGRKDAIFRTERSRMRYQWFPSRKAEYMTALRWRELGLTRDNIGERDPVFGTAEAVVGDETPEPEVAPVLVTVTSPEKAHTILSTLVPETLTFYRKPIPLASPPPSARPISPLIASSNTDAERDQSAPLAIYGSVSAADIVGFIKGLLVEDADGSRMDLEAENIQFLGLAPGADRIKALGRWEADISPGGTGLEPVRKVVEILPSAEEAEEAEPQPAS
ncbi:hypothetical protein C8A05DRAFT_18431 [Staphylotrichum tortipilum]|uniref:Ribosomal protein L9 domain-containing protein n=1 Tax=Staphylotrichum tortipilum TaxID=2831512 RepID=A0AAN6MDR4_9PEZI|nr:hypothetical protein C8A05DRAFT_18431 [Staphylotrichum longicolle]